MALIRQEQQKIETNILNDSAGIEVHIDTPQAILSQQWPSDNLLPKRQFIRHPIRYRKENIVAVEETPVLLAEDIYKSTD